MVALFEARRCFFLGTAAIAFALAALSGCDSTGYSPDLRYPPRTDPIFMEDAQVSKDERAYPDRPGQLPVLSFANAVDPSNPLHVALAGGKMENPLTAINAQQRGGLQGNLEKMFGTPAQPKVEGALDPSSSPADITQQLQTALKLDAATLARGSSLYRIHCLHCHGLSGDGRGPTAFWVNPHPRDYRQGIFKFTSVDDQSSAHKPRREDLLRTVRQGIDGTSMPAFGLLPDPDLEDMVSYVIHLSLRGQVEYQSMRDFAGKKDNSPGPDLYVFGSQWIDAQSKVIKVEPFPYVKKDPNTGREEDDKEAIKLAVQRGHEYFVKGACMGCHTDYGRKSKFRYDYWGTLVKPTDITTGIYRGGRRPIDLYYRIYGGINGSGMLPSKDAPTTEIEDPVTKKKARLVKSVWDLVLFVEALPYPQLRAEYGIQID